MTIALGAGLAAYLCAATVAMTDTGFGGFAASLWLVLSQTDFGSAAWITLVAWVVAMAAAQLAYRQKGRQLARNSYGTAPEILYLLGLIIFAYARAATGHAADDGFLSPAVVLHTGHILAAGAWAGSVAVGVLFVSTWRTWSTNQQSALAHRLSSIATLAVPIVVLSGIANAFRTLGGSTHPWESPYVWILATKVTLVALGIVLGSWNRWSWMARLDSHQPSGAPGFATVLKIEACVLVVVLLFAGKLGTTMLPM